MSKDIARRGRLFVLSAPSGTGKSAVEEIIFQQLPKLVYSVSYTTRAIRPGEVDGRSYNFVDEERFKSMIKTGRFLEWAEVFGCFYGTGQDWVESRLAEGLNVLADLDVEGADSVRRLMPEAVLIFMVPPTAAELGRRLAGRGTETPEQICLRQAQAEVEIGRRNIFDFLVVNDNLETAAEEIIAIIQTGRGRPMSEAEDFWPIFFKKNLEVK